jgi:hypothetical protein
MATATFTTVVSRAIGDPLTQPIWTDQLQDNLNQLGGSHRNQLTNGGFDIWQRGAGPFTTSVYTADRWLVFLGGGDTLTVTQETSVVDTPSPASLKAVYTFGGGSTSISQRVEQHASLKGKTVSVSMRVQQGTASGVTLQLNDGVGTTSAATSTTTGSYVTLTATRTLSASATLLLVTVSLTASGTYYFDNAMLVIGPAPAPYQPLHPQEDLVRCQRYYEVLGVATSTIYCQGYQAAGQDAGFTLFWKVTKGGTPTITKNGTWLVTNCAQPVIGAPSVGSCYMVATVTALGNYAFSPNSTDDTVTAEYNP